MYIILLKAKLFCFKNTWKKCSVQGSLIDLTNYTSKILLSTADFISSLILSRGKKERLMNPLKPI